VLLVGAMDVEISQVEAGSTSALAVVEPKHLQVVVSTMSGQVVEFQMCRNDTLLYLRAKVSQALGLSGWQLRLLRAGHLLDTRIQRFLGDVVGPDESTLQVSAAAVPLPNAVETLSINLHNIFLTAPDGRFTKFRWDRLLRNERKQILAGEVDFFHGGDNMLEAAISKWPRAAVAEVTDLLLAGGADPCGPSSDDYTPLLSACSRGLPELANFLLKRGADSSRQLPATGEDALGCILNFFRSCMKFNARALEEDLELGKLCCRFRRMQIARARAKEATSSDAALLLADTRQRLSQVATEFALRGGKFVCLTKDNVLEMSGVQPETVQSLGKDCVWGGWPAAFLTFDHIIPANRSDFDESFVAARSRILLHHLSPTSDYSFWNSPTWRYRSWEDDDDDCSDYELDCPVDIGVLDHEEYKLRNRKYQTAEVSRQQRQRAHPARGRMDASQLARRLPARLRARAADRLLIARLSRDRPWLLRKKAKRPTKFQMVCEELQGVVYC